MKKILGRISNWKPPGPDLVQGFWLKNFSSLHERVRLQLKECLDNEFVSSCLTRGTTSLLQKDKSKGNVASNYRSITCLPLIMKLLTGVIVIHKQITNYMTDKLAHSITGFRKSHGTQNSLVVMLEKWKRALDKGEYVSALFMDLSKAFDTINHDLLIAKLKAYGFFKEALKLMKSYLKNSKQKVQINNKFSSERDVIAGVPP